MTTRGPLSRYVAEHPGREGALHKRRAPSGLTPTLLTVVLSQDLLGPDRAL
jgi:hypothetical protein